MTPKPARHKGGLLSLTSSHATNCNFSGASRQAATHRTSNSLPASFVTYPTHQHQHLRSANATPALQNHPHSEAYTSADRLTQSASIHTFLTLILLVETYAIARLMSPLTPDSGRPYLTARNMELDVGPKPAHPQEPNSRYPYTLCS